MAWVWLLAAIVAEVAGTTALKLSEGFSRLWPSVAVVVGYGASFVLLAQALKAFEVGVAYAVWSAVGTALIVVIGLVFFGESLSVSKVAGLVLVIAGVVLLNLNQGP